ncbi:MAG: esterase/lipase family protein [Thermoleophilaceae bacterium]
MRTPSLLHQPPIWREALVGLELAQLTRDPIFKGEGVKPAGGQPVLLIPGFLAGDDSLGVMTRWLRRTGHHTKSAGMRSNIDCSEAAVERLTERVECLADKQGQRVALIGQSRGGTIARVLAVRRPDLVSGIVTLGSPVCNSFAIHPLVALPIVAVGLLGTLGARGMFRHSCRNGKCCERFWEDLDAPFPDDVGYVAVYSKKDGIVDWRACLDKAAEHVEIDASHCGMAVSPAAYRTVAESLTRFRRIDARTRKPTQSLRRAA